MFRVASVRFKETNSNITSGKSYSYLYDPTMELINNDIVIVEARDFLAVGVVTNVNNVSKAARDRATKFIIGKVDLEAIKALRDRYNKIQEINSRLEEEFQQTQRYAIYAEMAKTNPAIAELLQELASVDPSISSVCGTGNIIENK